MLYMRNRLQNSSQTNQRKSILLTSWPPQNSVSIVVRLRIKILRFLKNTHMRLPHDFPSWEQMKFKLLVRGREGRVGGRLISRAHQILSAPEVNLWGSRRPTGLEVSLCHCHADACLDDAWHAWHLRSPNRQRTLNKLSDWAPMQKFC